MNYMNKAEPSVAIIGVGDGESSGWDLPRVDVVEHVLLGQSTCINVAAALVLQTEEGNPAGSLTSFSGYNVGNIRVSTDGGSTFTVSADGGVHQGVNELAASGLPRTYLLDDVTTPDTTAPATAITTPADGATVSGSVSVTASASDDRGVARVEFYLDGVLKNTVTAVPYAWMWDTTAASNGTHALTSRAYDAAGNTGSSAAVTVTVSNVADTIAPSAPAGLTATGGPRRITLTWQASTDNVGVTGYQVWRASTASGPFGQIATTSSPSYVNTGLPRATTYYYYVIAIDAAGNASVPSATVSGRSK
jgi:predicted phage tail protein